jgi:Polyketide cyclase / dehydrase and lipid transport
MNVYESGVIERPVEAVFALAANPQNDPLWSPVVAEARQTSLGSLGIGTTFQQVLRLLGRRLEITFEVTGFEQNRMVEIGRFSGRLRSAVGRRTFEPIPGGTRVTFGGQGPSGLFLNLLEPLVAGAARRQARRSLASLKQTLEAQP